MRKLYFTIIVIALLGWSFFSFTTTKPVPSSVAMEYFHSELANCILSVEKISRSNQKEELKLAYTSARKHYKHIEPFIEQFNPQEAKYQINGSLVYKHEVDYGSIVFAPNGFQKLEEFIFDEDTLAIDTLQKTARNLVATLQYISNSRDIQFVSDAKLLEMCQLQLYRIASLGLNGFDATISLAGITEAEWSLEGVESIVKCFEGLNLNSAPKDSSYTLLLDKIKSSQSKLRANQDYASFPRLEFIKDYILPINKLIVHYHNLLGLPWSKQKQNLYLNNDYLFGNEVFNLNVMSPPAFNCKEKEQADLGKLLFFDPILSKNNDMSCASCHQPEKGFTDGREFSFSAGNKKSTLRNVPTVLNAVFQKNFFHDGRAFSLEQQVLGVIQNPNEMNTSLQEIVKKLNESKEYKKLFKKVYSHVEADSAILSEYILQAIASYEKTLISFNSPFDQYLKGNIKAISKEAIEGYNLFAGKALCGSCHFFPTFNGTVPPAFMDSEFEVIGVPQKKNGKQIDKDLGRYEITQLPHQQYSFKTPTIRNITLSAPYMHNGVFKTLEEVVDFYHKGGGNGFGMLLKNQTLPFDSLQLNNLEKSKIVAFMKTLTDTTGLNNKPYSFPKFENSPILNNRKSSIY